MMDEIMIEVTEFSKRYGDHLAVDRISFSVGRGEIFGLLGPNGAGKTTTLECLEGLRTPSNGLLRVAGLDPATQNKALQQRIGVQLQSAGMPETITSAEAMRLFCAYHHRPPRPDLLARLGMSGKENTPFSQLSAGQQRRLALALAVAHEPAVLFLDEPTAGLDVASRSELHNMMAELRESGTTIILATHDMAEAENLSDRVAILLNGRLVAVDTPLAITATGAGLTKVSVHTRESQLAANGHDIPAVSQQMVKDDYIIYFSTDIGRTVPAIIERVTAAGDDLLDLRVERPSLEDRFLELTR